MSARFTTLRQEYKRRLARLCRRIIHPRNIKIVAAINVLLLCLTFLSYLFIPYNSEISTGLYPHLITRTQRLYSENFMRKMATIIAPRKEDRVNCAAIIDGKIAEIRKARLLSAKLRRNRTVRITAKRYLHLSSSCAYFRSQRGYILSSLTEEELQFPIAFSILVHKDIEMAERLLRAIYRPQNYYCIHVDAKAEIAVYQVFERISSCFDNVLLASERLKVYWATYSVLQADLICMETLWPFKRWKYFINLTGQEFPIKPNSDLVRILKAFDGANDIHATLRETYSQRWRFRGNSPPSWFRPVKGAVHITASRDYVDYVLHNDTAAQILKWVQNLTEFSDEAFFSTINYNPQLRVPGSYPGPLEEEQDMARNPYLSRYKVWQDAEESYCYADRWVRYICILTSGDLPIMLRSVYLFANKFFLNEDRLAINCLEEWLYNTTIENFLETRHLDVSYFQNLYFVKNQIRSSKTKTKVTS